MNDTTIPSNNRSLFNQMLCDPHEYKMEDNTLFEVCTKCGFRHYLYYEENVDPQTNITMISIRGMEYRSVNIDTTACVASFWIGKYPITNSQFLRLDLNGYETYPVINLTYDECVSYIDCLNKNSQTFTYRLPSYQEWLYAFKACQDINRFVDKNILMKGWFHDNSNDTLMPVGLLLPNDFGIYDMLGNVEERSYIKAYDDFYIFTPLKDTWSRSKQIRIKPCNMGYTCQESIYYSYEDAPRTVDDIQRGRTRNAEQANPYRGLRVVADLKNNGDTI